MPKRITYLEKHPEISHDQFFAHWSTTHADIAKDLPGVTCYLQNHVHRHRPGAEAGEPYRVDGIVELWFGSAEVVGASSDSEVSDRLIEDEKTFMAGLTGGPVAGDDPHPHWPYKLWVLGLVNESMSTDEAAEALNTVVDGLAGTIGRELNVLEENPRLLQRQALRHEPRIPELAVALGFETQEQAQAGAETLIASTPHLSGKVENLHLYVASVIKIV